MPVCSELNNVQMTPGRDGSWPLGIAPLGNEPATLYDRSRGLFCNWRFQNLFFLIHSMWGIQLFEPLAFRLREMDYSL